MPRCVPMKGTTTGGETIMRPCYFSCRARIATRTVIDALLAP